MMMLDDSSTGSNPTSLSSSEDGGPSPANVGRA
jgi:hypothetical protein